MAYVQGSSRQWVDVMREKRAIHEEVINLFHQQRSDNHAEKVNILVWYYMVLLIFKCYCFLKKNLKFLFL